MSTHRTHHSLPALCTGFTALLNIEQAKNRFLVFERYLRITKKYSFINPTEASLSDDNNLASKMILDLKMKLWAIVPIFS
jgi:hypothetical protein